MHVKPVCRIGATVLPILCSQPLRILVRRPYVRVNNEEGENETTNRHGTEAREEAAGAQGSEGTLHEQPRREEQVCSQARLLLASRGVGIRGPIPQAVGGQMTGHMELFFREICKEYGAEFFARRLLERLWDSAQAWPVNTSAAWTDETICYRVRSWLEGEPWGSK